jgi:hypothetical protein
MKYGRTLGIAEISIKFLFMQSIEFNGSIEIALRMEDVFYILFFPI